LFDDRQSPVAVAGFVFEGCATTRGMMTHAESSLQGSAMPWDVSASPGRFYSVLTSPLYHNDKANAKPWPMEGRIQAELGISATDIWTQAMEGAQ
jgi:hypothetical protein